MALDPNEHAVRKLRGEDSLLDDLSAEELENALELEREGKDRKTAKQEIQRRLEDESEGTEEPDEESEDGGGPPHPDEAVAVLNDEEEDEPEPASYPEPTSTETVIFDPLGTPSNVPTGHDCIHLPDHEYEPRCGGNVGAKGQRRRRNEVAKNIAECDDCRTA